MTLITELDLLGARDNSDRIQQFISNSPNGSKLEFPPGQIRQDKTVYIKDKNQFSLTGPNTTVYQSTLGDRTRAHYSITTSQLVSLIDFEMKGSMPYSGRDDEAYNPDLEAQHGVRTEGSQRVYLKRLRINHIWGDGIYIGSSRGKSGYKITEDVLAEECIITDTGRQGSSVSGGHNVVFNRMIYNDIRRAIWDCEPLRSDLSWQATNIHMISSIIGYHGLLVLANKGAGPNVSDIVLADNLQLDVLRGFFEVYLGSSDENDRSGFWILRNKSLHGPIANPIAAHRTNNLFVVGNDIPTQDRTTSPLVNVNYCDYVLAAYNKFGPQSVELSGTNYTKGTVYVPPPPTPYFVPFL